MKIARLATIGAMVMLILYLALSLIIKIITGLDFMNPDIFSTAFLNFFQFSFLRAIEVFYGTLFVSLFFLELFKFTEKEEQAE